MLEYELHDDRQAFLDPSARCDGRLARGTAISCRKAIAGAPMIVAFALAMLPSPAEAHWETPVEAAELVKHNVSYHDLDLTTEVAHRTLLRRVEIAVNLVCKEAEGWEEPDRDVCISEAWHDARLQVRRAEHRARDNARAAIPST
jgi:UrcA family protein